jgi:hypothetical protein
VHNSNIAGDGYALYSAALLDHFSQDAT